MGVPEAPAVTEVQQLILEQRAVREELAAVKDAVNGLGQNVQWVIDNVQGIFQMFSSPQFMAMLPNLMGGGIPDGGNSAGPEGQSDDHD